MGHIVPLSAMFLLDIRTAPTTWYLFFFHFMYSQLLITITFVIVCKKTNKIGTFCTIIIIISVIIIIIISLPCK